MDQMYHHQHTSSTSHHKIERTSIRTYYSNLDLSQSQSQSQTSSSSNQASSHQSHPQTMQLLVRPPPPVRPDYRQMQRQRSEDYMNQLERYIDDLDVDGDVDADVDADVDVDFENDALLYRRNRRGSYAPGMSARQVPGHYVELVPTSLQTAKGRMQHPGQQQQQQHQRLRSPSLPTIRQRDYVVRHQQKAANQLGNVVKGTNIDPGNGNRLNNPNAHSNQASAIGCQEEDTSGYLSDTPKNTHTPDIWYNDAASQNGSISGMGSASQADESLLSAAIAGGAGGGGGLAVGMGVGVGGVRRLRRSILGAVMPTPTPTATPTMSTTGPQATPQASKCKQALNHAYVIKGRRVPGQGHSYEPLAADGYLADG